LCLHLWCRVSTRGLRRLLLLRLLLLGLLLLRLPLGWLLLLRLGRLRVLLCLTLTFSNRRDLRLAPHLSRGRLLCGRLAILGGTLM
jgi:hypothetical protein